MDEPKQEFLNSKCRFRNRFFAEMVTELVAIAAETNQEELRSALAKVFDLRSVQKSLATTAEQLFALQRMAQNVRELHTLLRGDLDGIEKQIDALRYELELVSQDIQEMKGKSNGQTKKEEGIEPQRSDAPGLPPGSPMRIVREA